MGLACCRPLSRLSGGLPRTARSMAYKAAIRLSASAVDLYARPFRRREPVVCLDEKRKQLLKDSRSPLPIRPGMPKRQDYEYVRAGTCNLFVAVEPKGGRRTVLVTDRRAKPDFVAFVQYLLEQVYGTARRVVFHYTPKHASWLNMAEIEIGILDRQCIDRRLPDHATLVAKVDAWQQRRNDDQRGIVWSFTRQDADKKMARHYVS
jgi:hypothetical protein